jgi:hypothetical protein
MVIRWNQIIRDSYGQEVKNRHEFVDVTKISQNLKIQTPEMLWLIKVLIADTDEQDAIVNNASSQQLAMAKWAANHLGRTGHTNGISKIKHALNLKPGQEKQIEQVVAIMNHCIQKGKVYLPVQSTSPNKVINIGYKYTDPHNVKGNLWFDHVTSILQGKKSKSISAELAVVENGEFVKVKVPISRLFKFRASWTHLCVHAYRHCLAKTRREVLN